MMATLLYGLFLLGDYTAPATCALKGAGGSFFGFPPWWKYIKVGTADSSGACIIPYIDFKSNPTEIWLIGLAVLNMLLYLAGIVAVVAAIASGVGYITAGGDVSKAAAARQRLYYSFIGLIIVFIAAGLVAFIGNSLSS